jgi:hypothetical protein
VADQVRTLAAIQHGLLLAKTARDRTPPRVALDGLLESLRLSAPIALDVRRE